MKDKYFYYKIKNAKIDDIELRKVECVVTAQSAYDADQKLFKAGISYNMKDTKRYEMYDEEEKGLRNECTKFDLRQAD